MNSKIKSIEFKREWQSSNGVIYYHDIAFENGDKGQIGTKTKLPEKLAVGQSLDYEITTDDKGNKKVKALQVPIGVFKASQMPKNNDKTQRMIVAQNSIGNAIEFCKADGLHFDTLKVIAIANDFYNYVMMKGDSE